MPSAWRRCGNWSAKAFPDKPSLSSGNIGYGCVAIFTIGRLLQLEEPFRDEHREYNKRVTEYIPFLNSLGAKDEKKGDRSMSFRERWVELLYQAAKSPRRFRALVTPIGIVFWLSLTALLVFASLCVDSLAHFPRFVSPPLSFVIGSIFLTLSAFVYGWPVVRFFKARGSPVPLNPPQELVTTGLYAYVRNPMVSGWLSGMFSLGVLLGSISLAFIFTPLFTILNVLYIKAIEERELEKKFGEEYLRYKEKVPMFIPRLRKW
jgi:protein-S-isoprenylcysteine O-methyltransferase Ste14